MSSEKEVTSLMTPKGNSMSYDAAGVTSARGSSGEMSGAMSGKEKEHDSHKNGLIVTAGVIVADTVGAGMLSMSAAVAHFGWLLGGFLICVLLAMNVHICMIIWRLKIAFPEAKTFGQLAGCVFAKSSPSMGRFMAKFADTLQLVFIFVMLAADATSYGKGLGMLFYDVRICLPTWVLIGSAVLFPIHSRTRSIGNINWLLIFCVVAVTMTIVIPIYSFMRLGVTATRPAESHMVPFEGMTLLGILGGLNIMIFNFTCEFMIVEIVDEMKDPRQFPKAFWSMAYPFLCTMMFIAGIGGYYFKGDTVHGLILNNMPFGPSLRVVSACLVLFVLVAYLLKSIVLCRALHLKLDPANFEKETARSWAGWNMIVAAMFAGAWFVSGLVPFFTPFVDLMGATMSPICCILLPIFFYFRWWRDTDQRLTKLSFLEWCLIGFEILFGLLIMTVGTYDAVTTIMAGWHHFGAPFACHCENIWNTCSCSSEHPGMGTCSAATVIGGGAVEIFESAAHHVHANSRGLPGHLGVPGTLDQRWW